MQKLLLFTLLFLAVGCEQADQKDKYIMHDDFYYTGTTDIQKIFLEQIKDEYYIVFKEDFKEDILKHLDSHGFILTSSPTYVYYNSINTDYICPELLSNCMSLSIKGPDNVDNIPYLTYSNHLYRNKFGDIEGTSNKLSVSLNKDGSHVQYSLIIEYAELVNIIPYDYWPELNLVLFACTNDSHGNPAEIANWFYEVVGYPAYPSWGSGEWNK